MQTCQPSEEPRLPSSGTKLKRSWFAHGCAKAHSLGQNGQNKEVEVMQLALQVTSTYIHIYIYTPNVHHLFFQWSSICTASKQCLSPVGKVLDSTHHVFILHEVVVAAVSKDRHPVTQQMFKLVVLWVNRPPQQSAVQGIVGQPLDPNRPLGTPATKPKSTEPGRLTCTQMEKMPQARHRCKKS